jgi:HptB-dependent secretion and biofilm anti anti-sigma factor
MPHIHNQQHSAIIALPVRFNFSAHAEFFKQCENALAENRCRCLTLDFAAVQHIDSAAIGMMINVSKKAAQQGSSLTIQNASGDVDGLLALIKFEAVLLQHQTDARVNAVVECE